jgi:hypothetical protein
VSALLLRYRLRKLRSASGGELVWLARAQLALVWARLLVLTRPTGKLVIQPLGSPTAPVKADALRDRAKMLALAVERAAEHGVFRPTCLVRAVALHRLLRRAGIDGSCIRIGVRLDKGSFAAHAWVEWNGEVLGDRPFHTATFDQLCEVDLAGTR